MEVECNPKRFNWICVTGTLSYDMESIFFFPSTKCSEFVPGVKVGSGSVRLPS